MGPQRAVLPYGRAGSSSSYFSLTRGRVLLGIKLVNKIVKGQYCVPARFGDTLPSISLLPTFFVFTFDHIGFTGS